MDVFLFYGLTIKNMEVTSCQLGSGQTNQACGGMCIPELHLQRCTAKAKVLLQIFMDLILHVVK